jgi:hypothetical protein
MAEPDQFVLHPPVSPGGILDCHADHHHRYVVAPRPPPLDSAPLAVQPAPRVGTVVSSWSTARGIGAAQTVWSGAASPSSTDQDPPAMLGKRTI